MITELNDRYKEVLRTVVDAYLKHGEPVGSRSLSKYLSEDLSAATIRNVMADLEELGLLYAPHISAGRLPTQTGLRLFVDGLMEVKPVDRSVKKIMRDALGRDGGARDHTIRTAEILETASGLLSSVSRCASIIAAPKREKPLRQVEFVKLDPRRVLIVLVAQDGMIENRIMDVAQPVSEANLQMAAHYINTRLLGRDLQEIQSELKNDIEQRIADLDEMGASLVQAGLEVSLQGQGMSDGTMIVRGQSNLLDEATMEDMEQIRLLFDALENRKTMLKLLESIGNADGMQIFIGSENKAFSHKALSMIIAPYKDREEQIIGAIGVIGPTRLNYGRVVPVVDYTSQILTRILGGGSTS
jgi:heat-inducible transcriptional repressor